MKKFIFCIAFFMAISSVLFAKDYNKTKVSVNQSAGIPGENYAPLSNASIPVAKLKQGKFNLKYDFTVKTKKGRENAFIAMHINFPNGVYVKKLTSSGIFFEDIEKNTYYIEDKEGVGSIEFEVSIHSDLYDKKLPVDFSFEYYEIKRNWFKVIGGGTLGVLGVAAGVVTGVITGSPITGLTVASGVVSVGGALVGSEISETIEKAKLTKEDVDKLLEDMTSKIMSESKASFSITAVKKK